MKTDEWKYIVQLLYHYDNREYDGIAMHFSNLADATRKVLSLSSHAFIEKRDSGAYVTGPIAKARIIDAQTRSMELEVRLKKDNSRDKDIAAGLYYHFADGIESFERKSGISFSQYKGYNAQLSSILVAYIVQERGLSIKDSLAHTILQKATERQIREQILYCLEITHKHFGEGVQRHRSVQPTPSVEAFYYNKVDNAIRDLLAIDYNKLDEYLAWESDMKGFYSQAMLYKNTQVIADLFTEKPGYIHVPANDITPGIYLKLPVSQERDEISLLLRNLTNVSDVETNLRVGIYIDAMGRTEKVPELKAVLGLEQPKTLMKTKPLTSQKPIQKKRKGKGL